MLWPASWPLWAHIAAFVAGAVAIGLAGPRLAGSAATIGHRTRLGEALAGAILLGASTSLPGIVTSVTAAATGHPSLAMANALGGIAAQTAFLAIADLFYRRANLEHAAASPANILQAALLCGLLALLLMAVLGPEVAIWGVHPVTPVLFGAYVFGLRVGWVTHAEPMWRPLMTRETQRPEEAAAREAAEGEVDRRPLPRVLATFLLTAAVVALAGFLLAQAGVRIAEETGLSETLLGGLFTAISTSLPELVTSVAAVRRGALALAVGDIIGGNSFDTLFAAVSDIAYREGSIYHAIRDQERFVLALTVLLTSVLLMGLVRREPRGLANIGFESVLVLVLYAAGFAVLFVW